MSGDRTGDGRMVEGKTVEISIRKGETTDNKLVGGEQKRAGAMRMEQVIA